MRRVSAKEARAKFAELTDSVHYTGEPIIVNKQGAPFVAVVSLEDLERLESARTESRLRDGGESAEMSGISPEAVKIMAEREAHFLSLGKKAGIKVPVRNVRDVLNLPFDQRERIVALMTFEVDDEITADWEGTLADGLDDDELGER